MIDLRKNRKGVDSEIFTRMIWVSTILAMIFTLPALGIFLAIYFGTGNLVIGAIIGFGTHFVTLAFAGRISKFLTKVVS